MEEKDIVESGLIAKLVTDPSEPPDVAVLEGHIGRSSDSACVRIYPSAEDLQLYLEVNRDDLLHTEPLADDGGSRALVRAEAKIRRVSMMTARALSALRSSSSPMRLNKETLRSLAGDEQVEPHLMGEGSRKKTYEYRCTSAKSCSLNPCC